ncbi:MAG: chorismate mutase [Blastocatellia bacterium]|jgi:chorismate mutase|nr:chorismate mutase [Blastocatellia bacterium]
MSIEECRLEIDGIDRELLRLLNSRARLAVKVGQSKQLAGFALRDPMRERQVIEQAWRANRGPLDERAIMRLFHCIMRESRRVEAATTERSNSR